MTIDLAALKAELSSNSTHPDIAAQISAAKGSFKIPVGVPDLVTQLGTQRGLVAKLDEVAAAINAKTVIVTKPVPADAVKQHLAETGILAAVGQSIRDILLLNIYSEFDFTDPKIIALFDTLTAQQKVDLFAIGQVTVPLWETMAARPLDYGDILVALDMRIEDLAIPNPPKGKPVFVEPTAEVVAP